MRLRVGKDRKARPMVRVAFLMPDDSVLCRDYYTTIEPLPGGKSRVEFVGGMPPIGVNPPEWLKDPFQETLPGGLIVYGGKVKPGYAGAARLKLGWAPPQRSRLILPGSLAGELGVEREAAQVEGR